jgi:hypothetical protein
MCSGRESSSCSISGTCGVTLITIHKGILNISYVTFRFWQKYLFMFEFSLKNNFL